MTTQQYLQELAVEKRVLKGLDSLILPQRIYMPPDMLWEIWRFIPKSIKQIFIKSRQQRLIKMYVTSINQTFRYQSGILHDMLRKIPLVILLKFIKFGTPNKYYTRMHRLEPTFIDWINIQGSDYNKQFYIIYELINTVIESYQDNRLDTMCALINSILYVHRKFGLAENVVCSLTNL